MMMIAITTVCSPAPSTAASTMHSSTEGKLIQTSTSREIVASVRPPK
jgi:hypothetical protein